MPGKPLTDISDPRWLKAIAHPVRIRVLAMLEEEPASPVILADKLQQPLGTVAYHVRTLHELGLVTLDHTRQRRGATEHYYRSNPHPRADDEAWGQLSPIEKQRILTAVLMQISDYAQRAAAAGGFDRADAHLSRTAVKVDEQGWLDVAAAGKRFLDELYAAEEASKERLKATGEKPIEAGAVLMAFEALPFSVASDGDDPKAKPKAKRTRRPKAAS